MYENRIDLQAIDLRTLPPERWDIVMRQATRQAHIERSRVFRDLTARAWHGAAGWARRLLSARRTAEHAG